MNARKNPIPDPTVHWQGTYSRLIWRRWASHFYKAYTPLPQARMERPSRLWANLVRLPRGEARRGGEVTAWDYAGIMWAGVFLLLGLNCS